MTSSRGMRVRRPIGLFVMFIGVTLGDTAVRGWPHPRGVPRPTRREAFAVGAGLVCAAAFAVVVGTFLAAAGL